MTQLYTHTHTHTHIYILFHILFHDVYHRILNTVSCAIQQDTAVYPSYICTVFSHFSRVQLLALQTVACQAPLSMRFSRQEYWSGLPCPPIEDLPDPGTEPCLLYCRRILYLLSHRGRPHPKQTSLHLLNPNSQSFPSPLTPLANLWTSTVPSSTGQRVQYSINRDTLSTAKQWFPNPGTHQNHTEGIKLQNTGSCSPSLCLSKAGDFASLHCQVTLE